ncbi:MAG: hypothetical protein JOZ69_17225 [Myxococcales bacterium]|nr:hypothetical protein [Myxococcales bacterium]
MRPWAARPTRSPGRATPALLALGVTLARRGPVASLSLALAAFGAACAVVAGAVLARHGAPGAAARVPTVTTEAVAWIAGLTLAFAAAVRAFHHGEERAVAALVRGGGASLLEYVEARVGGLVLLLAAQVGGVALVAGAAGIAGAAPAGGQGAWVAARATLGAMAYAAAFAATVGPVTMAALAARTRVGGYLVLLSVLVVPELLSPWTSALLPRGWHELTSIPAALDAFRAGWVHPLAAGAAAGRGLAGLGAIVALSLVVVVARVARAEGESRA